MKYLQLSMILLAQWFSITVYSQALPSNSTVKDSTAKSKSPGGITIMPSRLEFKAAKGGKEVQKIKIYNLTDTVREFTLYLNDWIRDSLGKHEYYAPGTIKRSCANWVKVSKNAIQLKPGEMEEVDVSIEVPSALTEAEEMKWAMIFVGTIESSSSSTAKNIETQFNREFRIGVHVYQTPPEVEEKSMQVEKHGQISFKKDSSLYYVRIKNSGKTQLLFNTELVLTSSGTGEVTKLPVEEYPMFPEQSRVVKFWLPKGLKPGTYNIQIKIDAGDDVPLEIVESEIKIT